jgi:hypothetical protein
VSGHLVQIKEYIPDMWPSAFNRVFTSVHRPRLSRLVIYPVLVLLLGVWQSGYARHPHVESEWQKDAPRDESFTRVMVVGLSPDYNLRCEFEWFMVSQIRSDSTHAFASCDHMRSNEKLNVESVAAIVKEEKPDAVLTTQLVMQSQEAEVGGSDDTRGAQMYKAIGTGYANGYYGAYGYYGGFGGFGIPVVYAEFEVLPPITTIEGKASVISMLFATTGNQLIYELKVTAKNLHSTDDALASIADPIGKRLRRDGLIR